MRKFIKKIVLFLVLFSVCFAVIAAFDFLVIGNQYRFNYQASIIDKIDRLNSINDPKIILVGHSNLSFGIHSEIIEKEIGMPVVNLGLHGGLGNAFHERIAKTNINEGDIVIICHSTFDDDDKINDPDLSWITFDNNMGLLPLFRIKDFFNIVVSYPKFVRNNCSLWVSRKGNEVSDSCYSRNAFNKYGDIIYKPENGQMDTEEYFKTTPIHVPKINKTCINRLNDFNQYCIERKATMVVAGYPIAYGKYADFTKQDFDAFQSELEDSLECAVISHYTDYFYPYDYFYNTNLHLTDKGAEIRTGQLVKDLQNWIEQS